MIFFAFIELFFKQTKLTVSKSSLLLGGAISGFFGGISGHQGAFRSMFLSKADVTKEEFVATSSSIGLLIDLTRIGIYVNGVNLFLELNDSLKWVLTISILIAFLGSYLGSKCLSKTTMKTVQIIVAISLMVVGGLLVIGIL
jgi:uncharacterized membrane protein YfcA